MKSVKRKRGKRETRCAGRSREGARVSTGRGEREKQGVRESAEVERYYGQEDKKRYDRVVQ